MLKEKLYNFICQHLSNNGFDEQTDVQFEINSVESFSYFAKNTRSGVFPGIDHYLILVQSDVQVPTTQSIKNNHESLRLYVNSKIKTPRAFRFKVPNIVTLVLSQHTPDEETIKYVKTITRPWQGGEVHNVYYIDIAEMMIYCQNVNAIPIAGLIKVQFKSIDPSNRSYFFITEMMKKFLEK